MRQRLHPLTPLLKGAKLVAFAAVAVSWRGLSDLGPVHWLAAMGVILVAAVLVSAVVWLVTGYEIVGRELRVHEGLISRRTRTIPLERVQAIDVVRPLLARVFGLAELRLEVIGAGKTEAPLAYLTVAGAASLRTRLIGLSTGIPHAPASDTGAGEARVFTVVNRRLLLAQLLTPQAIAVPAGLAFVAWQASLDPAWTLIGAASTITAFLGVFQVPVRRVLDEWDFVIGTDAAALRVRQGLLNKRSQTVPPHRVQGLKVTWPLLWRRAGWARARLDVAGYAGNGEAQLRAGTLVPVAPAADTLAVATTVLTAAVHSRPSKARPMRSPDGVGHGPPADTAAVAVSEPPADAAAMTVSGTPADAAAVAASGTPSDTAAATASEPPADAAAVTVSGTPADAAAVAVVDAAAVAVSGPPRRARWLAPLAWSRIGIGVTDTVVVVREGVLTRELVVVPLARVQSVRVIQGPLQRALDLATVHVDTAGGLHAVGRHWAAADAYAFADLLAARSRTARRAAATVSLRKPPAPPGPIAAPPDPSAASPDLIAAPAHAQGVDAAAVRAPALPEEAESPSAAPAGPIATPTGPSAASPNPSAVPPGPSAAPSGPSAVPPGPSAAPSGPSAALPDPDPSAVPPGPDAAPSDPSAVPPGPSAASSGPSAVPPGASAAAPPQV
ncbi:PH domain-containing protein [Dactylosporangium sp. NPDC000521]|uniref:PH domain-containing protein n=1 Tax=Dactylosporangium sp. NPDC000521 TaxID=3363975 RepID=UPI00367F73AC